MVVAAGMETNPPVKAKRGSKKNGNASKVLPKLNLSEHLDSILKDHLDSKDNKYKALIRVISDPETLLIAYEQIKSKTGNMTPGTTGETLDGVTKDWLNKISQELQKGKFSFKPSRRVLIPKKDGGSRPLGVANPREKIVQKALVMVLERIYEPLFSESSHGFRTNKSCHTALQQIKLKIKSGYSWVIEGDISKCYDKIPHKIIVDILQEKVGCEKTIALIKRFLEAGYIVTGETKKIFSDIGTPQGASLSPILCNIVLDKMDKFLEQIKQQFEKGKNRKLSSEYHRIRHKRFEDRSNDEKHKRTIDPMDEQFRRLTYVRYADDFIVSIVGSKEEALQIREQIGSFLKNLALELNMDKTKVTSWKDGCFFLGTHIFIRKFDDVREQPRRTFVRQGKIMTAKIHPRVVMHAPIKILLDKLKDRGFVKARNKEYYPISVSKLIALDHADIVNYYNSIIRGIINYYSFVDNKMSLSSVVRYLRYSCGLTLAKKYKLRTLKAAFSEYGENLACKNTGISIIRRDMRKTGFFSKKKEEVPNLDKILAMSWNNKLTKSNIHRTCAICNSSFEVEMHHIRSVKDVRRRIKKEDATFAQWSGAFARKQIPLCKSHHTQYHRQELSKEQLDLISNYK